MPAATILPKTLKDYLWVYPWSRYGPFRNPMDFFWIPYFIVCRPFSIVRRCQLLRQFYEITFHVRCFHAQHEVVQFSHSAISTVPKQNGVLVECGSYKGGSTAKLSKVAELLDTKLVVYDSFEGLPENSEAHKESIFGEGIEFPGGRFRATINEVKGNIGRYGSLSSCEFRAGWFKDTLPEHHEPIAAAFIDVDLRQSTYECLKYLYPYLVPGGSIFSQDGHVPMVVDLLNNDCFWEEMEAPAPIISGLGSRKLVRITKPTI